MKNLNIITTILTFIVFTFNTNAQIGSIADPFTSLNQSASVTTAGIYYFNLGGTQFDTYVNNNGFVQIALDFGNGIGDLPISSSLDSISRGVLDPLALASLTGINEVRITSSSDSTDVVTTNDSIIWRVQNNLALHRGHIDTTINQFWTGQNADAFISIPTVICGPFATNTLDKRIMHNCGAYDSFTWLPESSFQREVWTDMEVHDTIRFQLWVKGEVCLGPMSTTNVISSCIPISWIDGNTYSISNNTATYSYITSLGCDSTVTLDLTINTVDASATQNGIELFANNSGLNFQWLDCDNGYNPIFGETSQTFYPTVNGNYAVAVDNGNCSDTSNCFLIENLNLNTNENYKIRTYPNPVTHTLNIESNYPLSKVIITDLSGRIVYIDQSGDTQKINLIFLPTGTYLLKTQTSEKTSRSIFVKI